MFASNSCEGKKTSWVLARGFPLRIAITFATVHRRASRQLLSLMGRVRGPGQARKGDGSTIISRLFEFEKLAERPDDEEDVLS